MIKTRSSLKALHAHRTGEYCAFSARRWAGSEVITHLFTSLQVARDKLTRQVLIFRLFLGKSTKINFLCVCVCVCVVYTKAFIYLSVKDNGGYFPPLC